VAETGGRIVGLVHCVFHGSTHRLQPVCSQQDLFTDEFPRRRGVGRLLIEAAYDRARQAGSPRVTWHMQEGNARGISLYDKLAQGADLIVYTAEQ